MKYFFQVVGFPLRLAVYIFMNSYIWILILITAMFHYDEAKEVAKVIPFSSKWLLTGR